MKENNTLTPPLNIGLDPIIPLTMAEIVEIKLLDYLKREEFNPGDPIPKELELAEALGVSRNVIREALSRFRMLGLIETRKKRGMILKAPDLFGGLEKILHPDLLSDKVLREIFEMRLIIEMGIADIVFYKKTPEDIKYLENLLKSKKKLGATRFRAEHEVEFHGKLYEITGNQTLIRFQHLLLPIFQYVNDYESQLSEPPKIGKMNHSDLVNELKTGTPESFRQAMFIHLEPHFDMLKNWKD
jgi:DNA-binding FadR family transcriptional regulator